MLYRSNIFKLFFCLNLAVSLNANLENLFENYKSEPSIREVQKQALKQISREEKKIKSWKSRVRAAAWLPKFKTGVGKNNYEVMAVRQRLGEEKIFNNRNFGNWDFEGKVEWDLEKLLFRKEEVDIQNKSLKIFEEKQDLIENITEAYFERRKAQIILDKLYDKKKFSQKLKLKIEIHKYEAYLDGMTDGWFSLRVQEPRAKS